MFLPAARKTHRQALRHRRICHAKCWQAGCGNNAALTQCWVTSPWQCQHQCLKYEACSSPMHTQTYRLSNRLSQLNAALSPVTGRKKHMCLLHAGIKISAAPKTAATVRKKKHTVLPGAAAPCTAFCSAAKIRDIFAGGQKKHTDKSCFVDGSV